MNTTTKNNRYNSQKRTKFPRLRIFFYFLEGSRLTILWAILTMLLGIIINFMIPQITSTTIDSILGDKPLSGFMLFIVDALGGREYLRENLVIIGCLIIGMTFFVAITAYLRRMFALDSAEKVCKRIRDKMYSHIQSLPFSWHSKIQTGDIIQRTTQDSDLLKRYISNQFIELFRLVILVSVGLTMMFSMNVLMAVVSTVFLLSAVAFSTIYFSKIAKWFMITEIEEGKMTALLQENLTGLRVVRAFGKQADEEEHYTKSNEAYTNLWIKVGKKLGIFWGTGNAFAGLLTFVIIFVGALLSVNGKLTTGELLAFISYNNMLIWPIRNLGRVLAETGRVKTGLERLQEILDAEPEVELENEKEMPINGEIEFKNVSFSYDGKRTILDNISFKIPKGSVFGIIGGTGCGKSTVAQLINRLYDATSGDIYVDNVNVRDIKRKCLRKNIGIVLQEPFLFSRKIVENISIAKSDARPSELDKYVSIASLESTIAGLSEGYDSMVGEKGVTLSGGQKQRLAIARTLIQELPVVIFDDSLSAVDMDTDQKIRQAISENLKDTTVILISHRITSLMHAEQIMVLNNGRVERIGTHSELIKAEGTYKRLYELQTSTKLKENAQNEN